MYGCGVCIANDISGYLVDIYVSDCNVTTGGYVYDITLII